MITGAHVLVHTCGNVQSGENVLVATDIAKLPIAQAIATAAVEVGAEVSIVIMTPRKEHGAEPPPPFAAAMQEADIIFAPTSVSLFHSQARREATEKGVRFCNMVDYRSWMMKEGGLLADFFGLTPLVELVSDRFSQASEARVKTVNGTDIMMDIRGRDGLPQRGMARKPGHVSSPPDIEAAVGPVEGSARGVIVVDGSIPHEKLGILVEPISLTVNDGYVTKIDGGKQAKILSEIWEAYHENSVYNLAELGIGLNPQANLCGAMLEDEGAYGTVHFGFGDNQSFGGQIKAPLHLDVVVREPDIVLDDQTIMVKGELSPQFRRALEEQ
jgi:leucyl aminopeptidase (aminopeptidase T)